MSGKFTRKSYDECAIHRDIQDSISPINYHMEPRKYINNSRSEIKPSFNLDNSNKYSLIDIESGLLGLDQFASLCDEYKYPLCNKTTGCILTHDPSIKNVEPLVNFWGYPGDKTVITTNRKLLNNNPKNNPKPEDILFGSIINQ